MSIKQCHDLNVYGTKGRAAPLAEFMLPRMFCWNNVVQNAQLFADYSFKPRHALTATLRQIPQPFIHIVSLHSDMIVLGKMESRVPGIGMCLECGDKAALRSN